MATRRGISYRRLLVLAAVMGVMILLAAAAPTLGAESVAVFAMGASAFAFIAVANTTIQLTARPDMRGRVMALYAIAFLGSTPIGGPLVGWVSQQWGPRLGFALGGIGTLVATAWAAWALLRVRSHGALSRPEVAAVPAA
jgi:predicted MFS family arabinose efflux permease